MIVVAIIGILAAIAIPNFIRYQIKAKQTEASTSLKSIYTSEVSYFAETDSYTSVFTALGWEADSTRRFTYDIGGNTTGNQTPRGGCIRCCCGGDHQLYGTGVWTNRRRYHG
mgnify:CR=1 FL=1